MRAWFELIVHIAAIESPLVVLEICGALVLAVVGMILGIVVCWVPRGGRRKAA